MLQRYHMLRKEYLRFYNFQFWNLYLYFVQQKKYSNDDLLDLSLNS